MLTCCELSGVPRAPLRLTSRVILYVAACARLALEEAGLKNKPHLTRSDVMMMLRVLGHVSAGPAARHPMPPLSVDHEHRNMAYPIDFEHA